MTEIIPAILTDDPAELERLLKALKAAGATRVHLDIMDDTLVSGRTIVGHAELTGQNLGLKLDVHLMVARPDEHIPHWDGVHDVERFIMHVEAEGDLEHLSAECVKRDRQFWVAINPDTPLGKLTGLSCHLDGAMFMTVVPGAQGRPFRADVLEKIQLLKAERELAVMVDGGITPTTAPQCVAAGASHLVAGSFVIKSSDPAAALKALVDSVR
jgi:ribulose-phosphate 3-epimerase